IKEVGLQAVSAILKFPIPSVEDCKKRIGLLLNKLNGLDVERQKFGEKLVKLDKEKQNLADWASQPDCKPEKQAKIPAKIKGVEEYGKKISAAAEDIRVTIVRGVGNHKKFSENLKIYEDALHSGTKYAG